jgi:hypothetical protein
LPETAVNQAGGGHSTSFSSFADRLLEMRVAFSL